MKYAQLTCLDALDPLTRLGPKIVPHAPKASDNLAAMLERRAFEMRNHDLSCERPAVAPVAGKKVTVEVAVKVAMTPAQVLAVIEQNDRALRSQIRTVFQEKGMKMREGRELIGGKLMDAPAEQLPSILEKFRAWRRT